MKDYPWLRGLLKYSDDGELIRLYQALTPQEQSEVLEEMDQFQKDIIAATMPAIEKLSEVMSKIIDCFDKPDWME